MSIFHSEAFRELNHIASVGDDTCRLLIGPHAGTYGGFSSSDNLLLMDVLVDSAGPCTIKLAPASHDLQLFSRSMNVLHRAGFILEYADLNYDMPTAAPFADGLADGARKKLAKCERERFSSHILARSEWYRAYVLLFRDRKRKGLELSLPFASIEALEAALPGTYIFFGTFAAKEMIAAAICVRVRADILYIYAWGDDVRGEFAPTTHLCAAIYDYAQQNGYRLLDAGISTLKGVPNMGLIAFKESLGFRPSIKATMVRK